MRLPAALTSPESPSGIPSVPDWLLAGGVTLAAEIEVLLKIHGPPSKQLTLALAALAVVALAWRRRWPLLPMVALAVGTTVGALAKGPEQEFAGLAAFITAFSLGVYGRVWEIGVGAVVGLAGIAALNLLDPQPGRSLANSLLFIGLFVYGTPMLIGRIVRARSELVRRLREQSEELRVEREVTAAMAAAADRIEIVRELHRTVSGCVRELLAVVSAAEADVSSTGSRAAGRIEEIARQGLVEMRRLLARLSPTSGAPILVREHLLTHADLHSTVNGNAGANRQSYHGIRDDRIRPLISFWGLGLAAVFFAALVASIQMSSTVHGPRVVNFIAAALVALPLVWAPIRPVAAFATSLFAAIVISLLLTPVGSMLPTILYFVALPLSVGIHGSWRSALLGLALAAAELAAFVAVNDPATFNLSAAGTAVAMALGSWAAGRTIHDRSRLAHQLEVTNRELEEQREARARQAVLAERARVARELHDVIGHSLTVIVLQAGAARRMWAVDRGGALAALSTITGVARESLTELVSALDALDPGSPEAETLQLRDIEPLLERARLAGLEVDLAIDGRPIPLSPAIELAAYRVLQEALTNVVKHAPQARTSVRIRYGPETVDLLIKNPVDVGTGIQVPHSAAAHGLVGMRDRVSACGGRLEWTSDPGEFAVKAQLPLSG